MYKSLLIALFINLFVVPAQGNDPYPVVKSRAEFLGMSAEFQPGSYRHMHEVFPSRIIRKGAFVDELPYAKDQLAIDYSYRGKKRSIEQFIQGNNTTGFLVIKRGEIVYEQYALGATPDSLITSFSVGKSITGTLVGLAIGDGAIKSVDDLLVDYLPTYRGSGYDGVTVKQALQMSSGVDFVEDYEQGETQFTRFFMNGLVNQTERLSDIMASMERKHQPGTVFNYSTGESTVLGDLVTQATGKTLADYLSEKVWSQIGMERDAYWVMDRDAPDGLELGGGSLSITLRDYGRFGLLMLNDGKYQGKQILPAGWVTEATTPDAPQVQPGKLYEGYPLGYQYQWWTFPGGKDHPYQGEGVFGQFLYINPAEDLVIVKTSVWPTSWDEDKEMETYALFAAIEKALR